MEQDADSSWLELEPTDDTDAMPQILGSSVSYQIADGPQQGRMVFMIRTNTSLERADSELERVAKANSFSLHSGVNCKGHQKDKRERLCRYIARPTVADLAQVDQVVGVQLAETAPASSGVKATMAIPIMSLLPLDTHCTPGGRDETPPGLVGPFRNLNRIGGRGQASRRY